MLNGHIPRKRFGQNFLHDNNIINKIVASIGPKTDDLMAEIGPGQAALTQPLLDTLDKLYAIELDKDLIPYLNAQLADKGLIIKQADALQFNFEELLEANKKLRVVGNLPYNISTPLLFHLFSYRNSIKDMHFMLQYEVIERICAKPNSKAYGRLSVMAQYYCQCDQLFLVPPGAFNPPPKVMSAIVRLVPKTELAFADSDFFEQLIKACFAQRRKTLRNNLKALADTASLDTLNCDLNRRPEQLSLDDFVQLAVQLAPLLKPL